MPWSVWEGREGGILIFTGESWQVWIRIMILMIFMMIVILMMLLKCLCGPFGRSPCFSIRHHHAEFSLTERARGRSRLSHAKMKHTKRFNMPDTMSGWSVLKKKRMEIAYFSLPATPHLHDGDCRQAQSVLKLDSCVYVWY